MQGFQIITNFLAMPIFFSGALFPVAGLPVAMRLVVRLNPLTYGVDGLRGALGGSFVFSAATDAVVIAGFAALLLAVSAYLFSRIEI